MIIISHGRKSPKIIQVLLIYSSKRKPLVLRETKLNGAPLLFCAGNLSLHNWSMQAKHLDFLTLKKILEKYSAHRLYEVVLSHFYIFILWRCQRTWCKECWSHSSYGPLYHASLAPLEPASSQHGLSPTLVLMLKRKV